MSERVFSAFPQRNVRIRKTGVIHPVFFLLVAAMFMTALAASAKYMIPDIAEAWKISQDMVEVQNASVSDGKCTTRKFIMTSCQAKLAYSADGRRFQKSISFSYVDLVAAPRSVAVVRSASDPSLATIDTAIDKIWHQIGMLAFILGVLGWIVAISVRRALQSWSARRDIFSLDGKRLDPIAVEITDVTQKGMLGTEVSYRLPGRMDVFQTLIGRKAHPFYLENADGRLVALAVTDERFKAVLLLDQKLKRLNLKKAERIALYEAQTHQEKAAA